MRADRFFCFRSRGAFRCRAALGLVPCHPMGARPDIVLDGSEGEAGGQILRTALTLAMLTGKAFELGHIRRGRSKPGLAAQHLAAVRTAAAIVEAEVEGAELESRTLLFRPSRPPIPGDRTVDIGTAGSTSLLLHTILPALAVAGATSKVKVTGGTHVRAAPTFHDLVWGWAPLLRQLGWENELSLVRSGFFPRGGGEVEARVSPPGLARPCDLRRRGTLLEVRVVPLVSGLPADVAVRMGATARSELRLLGVEAEVESVALPQGPSNGAALAIQAVYEKLSVSFGALGEKGKPAEAVAREAVGHFRDHHQSGMALDEHLGDQILLPLALASAGIQGGPTPIHRFSTASISSHLTTNAQVIRRFLPVEIAIFGREGEPGEVRVAPPGIGEVLPLIRQ